MAYDVLAESRRLLAGGVPEVPLKLTRRRRFIPVACDVDGDVAATLFVRRGVSGNPWLEAWALERRDGDWVVLGGGSGDGHDELFERRDQIEGIAVSYGGGWTIRGGDGLLPLLRRGVSHATMRLASQVAALDVADRRIEVPSHGLAIVVWASRRPPSVAGLSANGEPLAAVPLRDRERRRTGRGWFLYTRSIN